MNHLPFALIGATALGFGIALWACDARADAPGPADVFADLICDPITNAPIHLAPQFGPKAPPLAQSTPPAQISSITYPPHGTGGSGGHEPDVETPAPVPLPQSIYLTAAALLTLAWVGLTKKDA